MPFGSVGSEVAALPFDPVPLVPEGLTENEEECHVGRVHSGVEKPATAIGPEPALIVKMRKCTALEPKRVDLPPYRSSKNKP